MLPIALATVELGTFAYAALILGVGMLLWDTVEVGRNDAVNLTNAVYGARILPRRLIIFVAGIGVIAGATLSSSVMETARKGIFDPLLLDFNQALAVYSSVYLVDTILLYSYSAYGMPVSTTACLVFELLGAAFSLKFFDIVHWDKSGTVVGAIIMSIILSGVASFLIHRAVRGAIGDRTKKVSTMLLHGPWAAGGMFAGLCYFMIAKGMKAVPAVKDFRSGFTDLVGSEIWMVLIMWGVFALLVYLLLVFLRDKAARLIFPVLAVLGMLALAFAFGQNDLANCASPGLAVVALIREKGVHAATEISVPKWQLFTCGVLLVIGMATRNARRVTRAEIRAGSQTDHVALYAPMWCITMAGWFLKFGRPGEALAPRSTLSREGKRTHYDVLRACTITSVSACVIATASSRGLPVSTTYVTFAAVLATGLADRVFRRGDSALKLGRIIWVISSWFISAVIAAIAAGIVCRTVLHLGIVGMVLVLSANIAVRFLVDKGSARQEERVKKEAQERAGAQDLVLDDEA